MNKLIAGTEYAGLTLESLISDTAGKIEEAAIFNNASQAWNHTFYWRSLSPTGGGEPPAALKKKIEAAFGTVDVCKKELATAATTQFGNGWAWLVAEGDALKVIKTSNAEKSHNEHDHHPRRHHPFLQGLGIWSARRLQPWLAAHAFRPSPRRTSPKTSSRSTCRPSSSTATMTRSCRFMPRPMRSIHTTPMSSTTSR